MSKIEEYIRYLGFLVFILSMLWIFSIIQGKINKKLSKKIKKIKNEKIAEKEEVKETNKIFTLFSRLTENFEDRDKIRLKLLRAGDPFKRFGINENNYTSFKIIFTLAITLLIARGKSIQVGIIYGAFAYYLLGWYVRAKTRKRHELIETELDSLVSATVDMLEQGYNISEVFSIIAERIDKNNPLYEELIRAKIKIGTNMAYVDMVSILNEFQNNIGMEEIDNYCMALKQHEESGKAKRMLRKQLELLRSEGNNRKKRETRLRANYNSIGMALMVICITIVILVPLIITALESSIFHI